jgi:hypothetical protein
MKKDTRDKIVLHAKLVAEFASSKDLAEKSRIQDKLTEIEFDLQMNAEQIANEAIKIYERSYR